MLAGLTLQKKNDNLSAWYQLWTEQLFFSVHKVTHMGPHLDTVGENVSAQQVSKVHLAERRKG